MVKKQKPITKSKMNTIESNKMIALFMGAVTSEMKVNLLQNPKDLWVPIHGVCNWTSIDLGAGKILQYHNSWDWLKPVIDKILKTIGVKYIDECTAEEWFQYTRITKMWIGVDIKQAYYYVTEFILWYNQNQKANELRNQ